MRFRIFIGVMSLIVLIIIGTVYLAATSASDLLSARRALQGSVEDLEEDEIDDARARLEAASDRHDGPIASVLNLVPLVSQNLGALEAVADGAEPVLSSALDIKRAIDEIQEQDLVQDGRVQLDLIDRIGGPLSDEARALDVMFEKLESSRSGWLLPPLYDEMTNLMQRVEELRSTASKAAAATELAPGMFGGRRPRTYLVVLINNAELRGAGGILSGVGTVTMDDGRIRLGDFSYYGRLSSSPHEKVPSPPGFERRFGFAKADTTLWVNTTYSPEVPDVALVASRLYEKSRKVKTDGAIFVDPRGVAALMPPGATVRSPSGEDLSAEALPEYIYSTAYEELGGGSERRRQSLLDIGRAVFKLLAERGPGGVDELDGIAEAASGGHIRFVSFDPSEQEVLERVGASGSLPETIDSVHVNVQNHGADKLDFWMRRTVEHECSLNEERAVCATSATLRNRAPSGLSPYVSRRPNEQARNFLEIYVPGDADVSAVELDGEPVEFLTDTQGDRRAFGTDIRLPTGRKTTLTVTYTLPLEGSYELAVTPQPLTHDADVRVALDAPSGWILQGAGEEEEGSLVYEGELDATLTFTAEPTSRTALERAWDALSEFWNDDLF